MKLELHSRKQLVSGSLETGQAHVGQLMCENRELALFGLSNTPSDIKHIHSLRETDHARTE